jgi:Domain of unknown function (DUF4386)
LTPAEEGFQVDSNRRLSFVAGVLFIITFVTSIPAALFLYAPVLDEANYIVGAGADARVALGALLELLLIIANVGTAVVLFPILKRQNEGLSAMSQPVSLNAPSSPSASSASLRVGRAFQKTSLRLCAILAFH